MGVPRLCKFKRMWAAIHEGKFAIASIEMLDSRWAAQVGKRATKLSDAMKTGEFDNKADDSAEKHNVPGALTGAAIVGAAGAERT